MYAVDGKARTALRRSRRAARPAADARGSAATPAPARNGQFVAAPGRGAGAVPGAAAGGREQVGHGLYGAAADDGPDRRKRQAHIQLDCVQGQGEDQ